MRKIAFLFSIVLVLSIVLAACSTTPPQQTPAATEIPGITTIEPVVTPEVTVAPVETATEAPAATTAVTETVPTLPVATEASPSVTESVTATVTAPVLIPGTGLQGDARASTLLTQTVTASDGQVVGTVGDLAVNLNTTHVDYVIIKQEAGQAESSSKATGPTYIPVPWRAIQFTDQGAFVKIDSATLQGATTMDLKAAPIMIPSDWEGEFNAFWDSALPEEAPAAVEPGASTASTSTVTSTTGITGTSVTTPSISVTEPISTSMQGIVLTNALINVDLTGPGGQSLGKISDLLINMDTGLVTYVLVQPGEALGLGANVLPVPLQALARDAATLQFSLPVDLTRLATAPNFDLSTLPDITSPNWDADLRSFWQSLMTPAP